MDDTTAEITQLIERLRSREPGAVQELIARARDRLNKLAAKMLHESFPGVAQAHTADSVVHETYESLAKELEKVDPPTPAAFFRFAAHKVRQSLLDMATELPRNPPVGSLPDDSSATAPFEPADSTLDIDRKAMWAELHRRVDDLPEDVKAVFVSCHYLGLTQAEVAAALGRHPREVSRLWFKATILLKRYIPEDG